MVVYQKARFLRRSDIIIGEPFELSEYYGMKMTEEVLKEADEKILAVMQELREKHKRSLEETKGKKN